MRKNIIWEKNYKKKRFNKYPYNEVVSSTFNLFPDKKRRAKIKVLIKLLLDKNVHRRLTIRQILSLK